MAYTEAQIAAKYPESYEFTLQYEGGYVNDPDDPGGCTNMGITIGTLTDWRKDPTVTCNDVKALTEDEAAQIYAKNYWDKVWGNDLPVGLNTQVWDFGVNAGPSRAIKQLQFLVNSPQDGKMGPNTLQATKDYVALHGVEAVINAYAQMRQNYYESLDGWSKYGAGWTNRNRDCTALAVQLAREVVPTSQDDLEARIAKLEKWASSFPKF
jgi:lysozyme family protein